MYEVVLCLLDTLEKSGESGGDLFSGAKELEAWVQTQAVKKSIQLQLGRRSGMRWSLPPEVIGQCSRRRGLPL